MLIPEGLTEEEVLRVMRKVANEKKKSWRFGYHGEDDMFQQIHMHCIKVLNAGKFVPRGEKPIATQLLNFLRVHTRNKLSSDIRNTMYRYAQPDSQNNKTKWNLMHTLKIYSQNLEHSEIFARDYNHDEDFDREEIIKRIRAGLDINMVKDFLKIQNGVKISQKRQDALIERIKEVLGDDFYAC